MKMNDVEDVADELDVDLASNEISLQPGPNADSKRDIEKYISKEVRDLYDVYSYGHAAAILANSFSDELKEIELALLAFRITPRDIGFPGGNESDIPKKFSKVLRPAHWIETRLQGDLQVKAQEYDEVETANGKLKKILRSEAPARLIPNFIDGHKIDYVKGRVAFDLEWNSKDQTFDRDLYAFRAFHECGLISAGVMLTRSASLNPIFDQVAQLDKNGKPVMVTSGKFSGKPKSVRAKYGASTTWMGKLLYRLNAGRQGGCPVLVFGITPKQIDGLEKNLALLNENNSDAALMATVDLLGKK